MDSTNSEKRQPGFLFFFLALVVVLVWLFHRSFEPNQVLFANDLPLGAIKADANKMPAGFFGLWQDLGWLGAAVPSATPNWTATFGTIVSMETFAKFYASISMLILGVCAWFYFRTLKFSPWVCIAGGLAAALNSNVFSNACWGQSSRPLSMAMALLAFAFLHWSRGPFWLRALPAGFAVGLGVTEGFDIGAIFSIYVALYFFFYYMVAGKTIVEKLGKAVVSVGIMAVFAGAVAYQTIDTLFATQLKHAAMTQMKAETPEEKEAKWVFATQWSISKAETLRVVIPGLFGYRMTDRSGHIYPDSYWGKVGQSPGNPASRFNGSGEYAGVFVVLLALYALYASLRTNPSITGVEKKTVLFWSVLAFASLLLAWGRFAPFYQFFYALPHADAIRNPMKFMHPFHLAIVILFGYGLQALFREYIERSVSKASSFTDQLKRWWNKATSSEKKWQYGLLAGCAVSFLGALVYSSSRRDLEKFLQTCGFDTTQAAQIAGTSTSEVWIYVFCLVLSVGIIAAIMSGWFSGARARIAGIVIALFLAVDLGRADKPWIIYWDAKQKYESNPILDTLKDHAFEHRVIMMPFQMPQMQMLSQLYNIELLQQLFQYHNIQSLDVIQDPRSSSDAMIYRRTMGANAERLVRQWQLTNTRFILGLSQVVPMLNQQLDPGKNRFRVHTAFGIVPKPGVDRPEKLEDLTMMPNPNGEYALIEFTGALPRAKLYGDWQIATNSDDVLNTLVDPKFDPFSKVVLEKGSTTLPTPSASATNDAGTVVFESYTPKKIALNANATMPCILLFNDRVHPDWHATVDGQAVEILRVNYIMRGVALQPGQHKVVFHFEPSRKAFHISVAAVISGLLLMGVVLIWPKKKEVTN